jgi:hypothetical protein
VLITQMTKLFKLTVTDRTSKKNSSAVLVAPCRRLRPVLPSWPWRPRAGPESGWVLQRGPVARWLPAHRRCVCRCTTLPRAALLLQRPRHVQSRQGAREGRDRWTGTDRAGGGCRCRWVSSSSYVAEPLSRSIGPSLSGARGRRSRITDRTARRAGASETGVPVACGGVPRRPWTPVGPTRMRQAGRAGTVLGVLQRWPWTMHETDLQARIQAPAAMEDGEARGKFMAPPLHCPPHSTTRMVGEPRGAMRCSDTRSIHPPLIRERSSSGRAPGRGLEQGRDVTRGSSQHEATRASKACAAPGQAPGPGHASASELSLRCLIRMRAPEPAGGFDPKLGKEIRLDRGRGQDGTRRTRDCRNFAVAMRCSVTASASNQWRWTGRLNSKLRVG